MTIYGRTAKYGLANMTIYSLIVLLVVPPTLRLGPLGFAHTPPPELSVHLHQGLENLGVHVFGRLLAPDILFPRQASNKPITLAPEFVDRCRAGEPVWAGNADSKRLGQGQGDDRQPGSVRRAPVAA